MNGADLNRPKNDGYGNIGKAQIETTGEGRKKNGRSGKTTRKELKQTNEDEVRSVKRDRLGRTAKTKKQKHLPSVHSSLLGKT